MMKYLIQSVHFTERFVNSTEIFLKIRETVQNSDEKRVKFRRKNIQIKCEILINKKYFNFNLNSDFFILRFFLFNS